MNPHPTFFEIATGLALDHFRNLETEIVVLETGMGGRLDATNAAQPVVSVLTPIDYDHQKWLGVESDRDRPQKAGIIKPGVPVVSARQVPEVEAVIRSSAAECAAPLDFVRQPVDRLHRAQWHPIKSKTRLLFPPSIRQRSKRTTMPLRVGLPWSSGWRASTWDKYDHRRRANPAGARTRPRHGGKTWRPASDGCAGRLAGKRRVGDLRRTRTNRAPLAVAVDWQERASRPRNCA